MLATGQDPRRPSSRGHENRYPEHLDVVGPNLGGCGGRARGVAEAGRASKAARVSFGSEGPSAGEAQLRRSHAERPCGTFADGRTASMVPESEKPEARAGFLWM